MHVQLCETEEDMELDEEGVSLRLKSMTRAYVDNARVATMGEKGEASANAGSLRVLGLAGSLLNSWGAVLRIAEEFPELEALDLSGIRLESWPKERPSGVVFQNLRVFVLNNAGVKWCDICALGAYMPKLEELYLNGNRITRFDSGRRSDGEAMCFPNLRVLSVEENSIVYWSEIEELGHQAIAVALGGSVTKSEIKWNVGVEETKFENFMPWMSPEKNLSLYVFHEDQVSLMPKGCKLLGSTQNCKISSFSKGNHIFTTQAHPEFDYMFMKTIVEKYEEMLGPKIFKNAIDSLSNNVHGNTFSLWCENFIKFNLFSEERV